jgi:hypothetical protein
MLHMRRFFQRSQSAHPGHHVTQTLLGSGLPAQLDPAMLSVVQQRGSYAGRGVTYFRVFDPTRNAERAVVIRQYTDLDICPELVVTSGHIEQDGAVVLATRESASTPVRTERLGADRSVHADDEGIVFRTRTL